MRGIPRNFVDSSGMRWYVYVGPPRPEWFLEGRFLMFSAGGRQVGTFPVPEGWREWSDDQLAALCEKLGTRWESPQPGHGFR